MCAMPGKAVAHLLAAGGAIPNHPRWPLLLYPGAVRGLLFEHWR